MKDRPNPRSTSRVRVSRTLCPRRSECLLLAARENCPALECGKCAIEEEERPEVVARPSEVTARAVGRRALATDKLVR